MSQDTAYERLARMSASETVTATILHELTQPLAAASNYVAALRRIVGQGDFDREELIAGIRHLEQAVTRSTAIVDSVRALIVDGRPLRSEVAIETLFEGALDGIEGAPGINWVHIETDILATHGPVTCDPVQIEQVLVNLLLNAVSATRHEGSPRILLAAANRHCAQRGAVVQFSVADNGPGIEQGEAQLFRPFFSPSRSGTGLGLPLCRGLVELHGGELWHEPSPLGGSAFHFTLPRGETVGQ